jgi:H+-translocating NAD(P) transhydrogenase subunit alpha
MNPQAQSLADQFTSLSNQMAALAAQLHATAIGAPPPAVAIPVAVPVPVPVGPIVDPFIFLFAVFVLACFVGYYVVWNVTPALHSPLMGVTNAISSVIVVGAMLATGLGDSIAAKVFGFLAVTLASVNIFGGFTVTQRMLSMFKPRAAIKK